ncbi:MAG: amidohydrolase [Alphaproteobacteria bacterium]|nr:amidohydrolase [Alphaproteobacteria bacterium]
MPEETNRYDVTAARPRGKPGRETRPASTTIDIHAHVYSPEAAAFARPHLDASKTPLGRFATPATAALNRKQESERARNSTDLALRLADMDKMGVDIQVVTPAPPQIYTTLEPAIAMQATRIVNDGMAEFAARQPDRFVPMGTVPLQAGADAVGELERCMEALGFKGVEVLTNVAGRELSEPDFAPFWARAEQLGAVVMIHPGGFSHAERLGRFYLNNTIGNPLETTIALHYLILDGVLERHPNLKLLAAHGGGFLGAYSGRIDHAWGARSDAHGDLPHAPSTYLKRIWFDSVVFTPLQLDALVRTFGVEKIMLGTDYPYDMGEYDPLEHLSTAETLDSAGRAAVAGGNARMLFGI